MYPSSPNALQSTDLLLPPTRNILTSASRTGLVNSMHKVRSVLGENPIVLEHDMSSTGAAHITLMSPRFILNSNCPDAPVLFALTRDLSMRRHLKSVHSAGRQTKQSPDTRRRRRECSIFGSSPSPVTSGGLDRAQTQMTSDPRSAEKPLPRPPSLERDSNQFRSAIKPLSWARSNETNISSLVRKTQTSQRSAAKAPWSTRKPRPAPLVLAHDALPQPYATNDFSSARRSEHLHLQPRRTSAPLSAKTSASTPPFPRTPGSGSSIRDAPRSPLSPRSPRHAHGFSLRGRSREKNPSAAARRRKMNKVMRTLGHPVPVELVFSPIPSKTAQPKAPLLSRSKQRSTKDSRKIIPHPLPPLPPPTIFLPAPSGSPLSVNVAVSVTHDVSTTLVTLPNRRRAHSSASYLGDEKLPSSPPPFVDIIGNSPSWPHTSLRSPLARARTPIISRGEEVKSMFFNKGPVARSGDGVYDEAEYVRKSLRALPRI